MKVECSAGALRAGDSLWFQAALAGAPFLAGCAPDLAHRSAPGGEDSGGVVVDVQPSGSLEQAPRVARFRVHAGDAAVDLDRLVFTKGGLGPAHLKQLEERDLSNATQERILPALVWRDPSDDRAAVIAPIAQLEPGEEYGVGGGDPPFVEDVAAVDDDPVVMLARTWPPAGASATARAAIWCGDAPLPPLWIPVSLDPGGPSGTIVRGVTDTAGEACVRFELAADADGDGPWLPPPAIPATGGADGALLARLDPRPLVIDVPAGPVPYAACEADEVVFGPGCARVTDDRIIGRAPGAPLQWAVHATSGAPFDRAFVTGVEDAFILWPFAPLSPVTLEVAAVDATGTTRAVPFLAMTAAPMPHLVINEVLANPLGPEPAQEWVEIVNDGQAPAELADYSLEDIGGTTALPSVTLPPGGIALVVNEAFVEDDELDPVPAPSSVLVRVPKLGQDGLTNQGEPLKLVQTTGAVVSRWPAAPKPKAGSSVARVSPRAPDGVPSSFAITSPTPGSPNGLERL